MLESGWVFGAAALLIALGALAAAALHVVWEGQRLVVFRFGRVSSVRGPGLALVLPGAEHAVRVPMTENRLDLLWLDVTTADDVTVTVNGTALMRVTDPVAYAERVRALAEPPRQATTAVVADEIRRLAAGSTLLELSRLGQEDLAGVSAAAGERSAAWGVTVRLLEISRMQLSLDRQLIRWAERFAGGTGRTR